MSAAIDKALSRVARAPAPRLRPFVEALWAMDRAGAPATGARERVLPTGGMHLAMSLTGEPFRVSAKSGTSAAEAFVGGARSAPYLRDLAGPRLSVGVQLRPGACEWLFDCSAAELAETHTPLDELWGASAKLAVARVAEAAGAAAALDALEAVIAARLPRLHALHPAVAHALERFEIACEVGEVVRETGCSHRRFIELFRRAVGLSPKRWCRLRRFRRAVAALSGQPPPGLAALALDAGYSDQSHFSREFRALAGMLPAAYRRSAPARPGHVPLAAP